MLSRRSFIAAALATPGAALAQNTAPTRESATLRAANGRSVPLSIWRATGQRQGRIAFSHGAQSSPWKYPAFVESWTAAGFDVFAPLHTDSLDHPARAEFQGLQGWASRIADMRALSAYIGAPYIAAGHSYGALTALVLGGVETIVPADTAAPLRDPAVRCSIAFSPPGPLPSLIPEAGFSTLAVPALIQTGTRDLPPGGAHDPTSWRTHLTAFERAAPDHDRYALILQGVDHYFGGLICDQRKAGPDQRTQLAAALREAKRFLKTFGQARPDRKAFRAGLGPNDNLTWLIK